MVLSMLYCNTIHTIILCNTYNTIRQRKEIFFIDQIKQTISEDTERDRGRKRGRQGERERGGRESINSGLSNHVQWQPWTCDLGGVFFSPCSGTSYWFD